MSFLFCLIFLVGCPGSGSFGGPEGPPPDVPDGFGTPGEFDLGTYAGFEYLNIRWEQEQLGQGFRNCLEIYEVEGTETTGDDADACPDCDAIWTLSFQGLSSRWSDTNEAAAAGECLPGTGLEVPGSFERRVGMVFGDEYFGYQRAASAGEELGAVGIGSFAGVEFTWSGTDGYAEENSELGYSLFYSGEGAF